MGLNKVQSGVHLMTELFFAGFNVETVEYKNISFTVWDVGGQDKVSSRSLSCVCGYENLLQVSARLYVGQVSVFDLLPVPVYLFICLGH